MIGENGFDNLVWFMGLVEDNNDPLSGRVRVRAFGFHPPYSDGLVATDDLPWAHVIRDSKFASVPDNGDLVVGFFTDGRDAQHPIVIGVLNSAKFSLPTTSNPYSSPGNTGKTPPTGQGKPVPVGQAANKTLQPHQRAFLDAIASKESGGAYNIRYDGKAGSTFDLSSGQHPNVRVPLGNGSYSTAAGRYQFTYSTWQEVSGGAPFTPENQDYYAYQLAKQRYPGDLDGELKAGGLNSNILTSLQPTWASFASGNQASIIATYNQSMAGQGVATPTANTANPAAAYENPYVAPSQDSIDNFGNGAMPPQISGENLQTTPAVIQATARKDVAFAGEGAYTVNEPGVPVAGSIKSSVWNTRHGGSHIELSGKSADEEFISITHVSGSRVTLDSHGNVTVKAFGKLHLSSEGVSEDVSDGTKVSNHKGGYMLEVSGGNMDVNVLGDINFSASGDITLNAGRKITMSSGDAINMAGSKVAITAIVDAVDIAAAQKLALYSGGTGLSIKSVEDMFVQAKNLNLKGDTNAVLQAKGGMLSLQSKGSLALAAEGNIGIGADGQIIAKGSQIHLNDGNPAAPADAGDALDTVSANVPDPVGAGISTPTKPLPSPSNISPEMLDESGPQ